MGRTAWTRKTRKTAQNKTKAKDDKTIQKSYVVNDADAKLKEQGQTKITLTLNERLYGGGGKAMSHARRGGISQTV